MSSRITVSVQEARPEQLREFLTVVKGVECTGKENSAALKTMLQGVGWMEDFITVADTRTLSGMPNDGTPQIQRRPASPERLNENKEVIHEVRIQLQTTDKEGGDQPVPVGLNGMVMLVPRGRPVWVREEYVEILKASTELVYPEYDQEKNLLGGLGEPREVMSYPFAYA